jgi:pantothenate kinase type III
MLLAIDVGNTNIVLGVFDKTALLQSWRLQTLRERTSDELGLLVEGLFHHSGLDRSTVNGIILGSVVPPLTGATQAMAERYFGLTPLVVDPAGNSGMPILYENPSEVGADRIVNAIAAREQYGGNSERPLIVCDFGTATTLDAVSGKGEYLGGAICPGVTDRHRSHHRRRHGGGALLRVRRDGRRAGAPDERRARRQCRVRRHWRACDIDRTRDAPHRSCRRRLDVARPENRLGT